MQVENENLSSSLQNEKLAHQEMRQQLVIYYYLFFLIIIINYLCICRIHNTRNMCIALKDHIARVEVTVEQGNNC